MSESNNENLPSKEFERILRIGRLCSSLVGANVSMPSFRVGKMTCITITLIAIYFLFTIMTIIKKFDENWKYAVEAACTSASVIQGATKMMTAMMNAKNLPAMVSLLQKLYKKYERQGAHYSEQVRVCCGLLNTALKSVGIAYVIGIMGVMLTAIFLHITTGDKYLVMHFHCPGLDVDTTFGYYSTMVVHIACGICGIFGLFAGDFFVILMLMQSDFFIRIFKMKVQDFNELVEAPENCYKLIVGERLVDLIHWQQLYMYYTNVTNEISLLIVSSQVTTTGVSIVLTIFILITGDWYGGYAYMLMAITNLYVYCIIGTRTDICNSQLTDEIYNISWYNLRVKHQKMVCLMLQQSQSPICIDIGGVIPLNVETALRITKSIYTMTMMMLQFLGNEEN